MEDVVDRKEAVAEEVQDHSNSIWITNVLPLASSFNDVSVQELGGCSNLLSADPKSLNSSSDVLDVISVSVDRLRICVAYDFFMDISGVHFVYFRFVACIYS